MSRSTRSSRTRPMDRCSDTELKTHTDSVFDSASREAVVIARHGTPRFVIMSVEHYEHLIDADLRHDENVEGLTEQEADELIGDVEASVRDE